MIFGKSFDGFKYLECDYSDLDFNVIYNMIKKGSHEGAVLYVIRGKNNKEVCEKIVSNFDSILEVKGTNREFDGYVNVDQVGSSQFAKSGFEYMLETRSVSDDTAQLFDDIPDEMVANFLLDDFLEEGFISKNINFRPSRFKSTYSNFSTIRRWLVNGSMSLHPHEDIAQLEYAKKDGYEIHKIKNTIACNACVSSSNDGGKLIVWNVIPSEESRKLNNVFDTGYPYSLDNLTDFESISIDLKQGDIYFMNASLIHGVTPCNNSVRTTMGRFIGQVESNKVVYWT